MSGITRAALAIGALLMLTIAAMVWIARPPDSRDTEPRAELVDLGAAMDLPDARGLALRPGKDRWLVENSCTTCHSLAPIVRHDGFSKRVWGEEVRKMIDSYGAPIEDDAARRITAYLRRHYSAPPPPAAGTSSAPGTR